MSLVKAPAPDAAQWHSSIAAQFDSRYDHSAAFRERLQLWTALIQSYGNKDASVLDAGCGSGVLSLAAAGACRTVLGIDGGVEMIRLCQAKAAKLGTGNATFQLLRLEDLSALGAQRFNLILCSSVLEYLDDFWGTLAQLQTCLAPGGVLLFSVPNSDSLYRRLEQHTFRLTGRPAYLRLSRKVPAAGAVRAGLHKAGLEILETRYYAPTPVLSQLARRAGFASWTDNLIVFACKRQSAGGASTSFFPGSDVAR